MAFSLFFDTYLDGKEGKKTWRFLTPDGVEWSAKEEWKAVESSDNPFTNRLQLRKKTDYSHEITISSCEVGRYFAELEIFEPGDNYKLLKRQALISDNVLRISRAEYDGSFFHNRGFSPIPLKCIITLYPCFYLNDLEKPSSMRMVGSAAKTLRPRTEKKLENLSGDMQALLSGGLMSDVVLVSGSTEIKAHKVILSARSPVFAKMFSTPMKESKENRVEISDIETAVLQDMIAFIYTGIVTFHDPAVTCSLYVAADKYSIKELKNLCSSALKNVTYDTVINTLILADVHGDTQLKRKAMEFVSKNYQQLKDSEPWQTFVKDNLSLSVDVLSFVLEQTMLSANSHNYH